MKKLMMKKLLRCRKAHNNISNDRSSDRRPNFAKEASCRRRAIYPTVEHIAKIRVSKSQILKFLWDSENGQNWI